MILRALHRLWRGSSGARLRHDADDRWVVVDVETTGLDPSTDRLLAIAGVAVRVEAGRPWVVPADSFEVVLHEDSGGPPDRTNVLLHGIGVGERRRGVPAGAALTAFANWAGGSPRLGFHAGFDRAVLDRAAGLAGVGAPSAPWVDLEPIAAVLHPTPGAGSLDDWLGRFGIECAQRHRAPADALATAELLLALWPALRRERATTADALARLARSGRWARG